MDFLELMQRLAVSLAIGLLVGVERGWKERNEAEGGRTAGLRTFALTGLLGGVACAVSLRVPAGGFLLGMAFLAYAAILGFLRFQEMEEENTHGATTIVAALLTFALGALAMVAEPIAAGAAGVATTALLALKSVLHEWLKRITWQELRAGLVLLAMSVILLPILPDKGYGPFAALNPYDLWRMTVLIATVSALGYIAIKWIGGGQGIALSGIAGGLVSSTAVTISFAKLAKEMPARERLLIGGALLACSVMMVRILIVALAINPGLSGKLFLPLMLAAVALVGFAYLSLRQHFGDTMSSPIKVDSPFELGSVLKFGLFLAVIMVLAKGFTLWAGDKGAYALAAVSGITDVDAVTLSLSRMGGNDLPMQTAAHAILLTAVVNSLAKAAWAWTAGGRGPGMRLASGALVAVSAMALGIFLSQYWDTSPMFAAPAGVT
jgi:uncharacterized membrane protein (DUF4010 family)